MSRWHTTEFDLLPERAFRPRGGKFGGGMTLEGGGKDAPAPDPRMAEAANRQIDLAEKQYADYRSIDAPWMKDVATRALGATEDNAARAGALSDYQLESMRFNDDRYRSVGIPYEDQLLAEVGRMDSQGYKDQQVGSAMADVQQAFGNVEQQGLRARSRMGVNPNSASFWAPSMDIAKASALSSAANKTRMAADQIGLSNKMQMYGGMRGLAGLGATSAGLAINSIGAGNQSGAGMTSAAGSYLNANNAAAGTFNAGMSAGIQGLGSYSKLGIDAANVNAQNDPFNTVLGAAAGVATSKFLSDRRAKKNIRKIGELEDGLGIYQFEYKHGGGMQVGVMADEVKVLRPWAYIEGGAGGGFDAVDYSKI